tara:strand:- start:12658 stop:13980 length:1323 start_codon:yes stop_codon:yes gene_type:complete
MKTKFLLLIALFFTSLGFSQKKWTLKEAVDHALKNNITIQQNLLNVELAQLDVKTAKGNFLPNLTANNSHSGTFGLSSGVTGVNTSADRYSTSISLNGGGTIFNGYRNLNTYKRAQLGVESSKLDLEKIQNDISLFVVNGYLNILFAKENLNVARVQADISKKQVEAAKERFDAGIVPKGDLLNAQSTAANDQQNVVTNENTLTIALLNLAQLLQIPTQGFDILDIEVGTPSGTLLYNNADMVYQKALTNQPQIKNAELAITNADLNIKIAKGAFLPSITYSAGANSSYFSIIGQADLFDPLFKQLDENLSYTARVGINIPIFNRNQTKTNIARQHVNKEIARVSLDNQKLQLQQTIEQAFVDSKAAAKTYEVANISLEAQREAFKNAQESYSLGAMTLFDFDLVRNRLVSAESAVIRAKYNYVFKTKVLQFYYGELNLD